MPGKLKVRVVCGRGLPIMDKSTDLTDAFVEIRFRNETLKTEVCKKSLNPQWNSEWFKFEVEDEALQDEPLELRVLDHDTYSAHDAIGKVYVDLNPLLTKDMPNVISGWFPIYDTMHGIRGELNIIVKVELFSDVNKFRQSSCGIQFFSTTEVPYGYRLQIINGFVEELVVNDDPEYQWIDKIRTPRASNEARQRLFSKLSGELQRKIGVKFSDLGGNSVIGYFQCFDLEGESGIVVRGIGTAVNLTRPTLQLPPSPLGISPQLKDLRHAVSSLHQHHHQHHHHHHITRSYHHITMTPPNTPGKPTPPISPPPSAPPLSTGQSAFNFPFSSPVPEETALPSSPPNILRSSTSPVKCSAPIGVQRRSSESDLSNTTPPRGERSSLTGSSGSGSGSGTCTSKTIPKLSAQQPSIELMEYPFFTMTSFPAGFIVHLGGVVSAKSVKLLDRIHNPDEPETRDAWWTEIRNEIRSHMRSMGCHAVLGYTEQTTISDEIIVLSATGTAARVNLTYDPTNPRTCIQPLAVVSDKLQTDKEKKLFVDVNLANSAAPFKLNAVFDSVEFNSPSLNCSLCHVPYKTETTPFPVNLSVCAICRRRKVPDVLFTTIDPPVEIHTYGKGSLIQARVCRTRIKSKSAETNAKEISDGLPFLEYELHSQLMNKLRLRGMNGLFGLKIQIAVSETVLVGIATATAVFFGALPAPPIPKVSGQVTSERENNELLELQKKITDTVQKNREKHDLHNVDAGQMSPRSVITDDSDDDISDLEVSFGNKEVYVIEVDDANDKSIISLLNDSVMPDGFTLFNTKKMPDQGTTTLSCNLQMFSHVWRGEFNPVSASKQTVSDLFEVIIKKICYKLRKMSPCSLCSLDFDIDLPEENELQISLTGVCCGLEAVTESISDAVFESSTVNKNHLLKMMHNVSNISGQSEGEDMMFHMEEVSSETNTGHHPGTQSSHVNHSGDQTSHVNNSGDQSLHAVSSGSQSSHGTSSISQSSHGTNPGNQSSHAVNSGSHSLHGTSSSSQSSHVTNPGNQSSHGTNPGNQSSHAVNSGSQSSHGTSSSSQLSHGTNPINLSSHGTNPGNQSSHGTNPGNQSSHAKQQPKLNRSETKKFHHPSSKPRHWVEITPLSFVPGTKVERYLGNYNFFFIRETTSLREMGGLSGFMQAFIAEVLCNVRANVSALGGNGLVTYRMSQCVLLCNPHKNQSQCLINVSGDAVVLGVEEETIIVEPVRKNSTSPLPTHTS